MDQWPRTLYIVIHSKVAMSQDAIDIFRTKSPGIRWVYVIDPVVRRDGEVGQLGIDLYPKCD